MVRYMTMVRTLARAQEAASALHATVPPGLGATVSRSGVAADRARVRPGALALLAFLLTATTIATAPNARAEECWSTSKGKVCENGFGSGDWPAKAQILGVLNSYNYCILYGVRTQTGERYWDRINGGQIKWYDRDTVSVTMGVIMGRGTGAPVGIPTPCPKN